MGLVHDLLTWLKKGEKLQGTDTSTPNSPNGVLNRPLNQLLENDVDLDSRVTAIEGATGGVTSVNGDTGAVTVAPTIHTHAHADMTGIVGADGIHLTTAEKALYDGLDSRVTTAQNDITTIQSSSSGGFTTQRVFRGYSATNPVFYFAGGIIKVTLIGAGGAGSPAVSATQGGNGGGAGGAIICYLNLLPGNITINLGNPGVPASGANGGVGENSSIYFNGESKFLTVMGGFGGEIIANGASSPVTGWSGLVLSDEGNNSLRADQILAINSPAVPGISWALHTNLIGDPIVPENGDGELIPPGTSKNGSGGASLGQSQATAISVHQRRGVGTGGVGGSLAYNLPSGGNAGAGGDAMAIFEY